MDPITDQTAADGRLRQPTGKHVSACTWLTLDQAQRIRLNPLSSANTISMMLSLPRLEVVDCEGAMHLSGASLQRVQSTRLRALNCQNCWRLESNDILNMVDRLRNLEKVCWCASVQATDGSHRSQLLVAGCFQLSGAALKALLTSAKHTLRTVSVSCQAPFCTLQDLGDALHGSQITALRITNCNTTVRHSAECPRLHHLHLACTARSLSIVYLMLDRSELPVTVDTCVDGTAQRTQHVARTAKITIRRLQRINHRNPGAFIFCNPSHSHRVYKLERTGC